MHRSSTLSATWFIHHPEHVRSAFSAIFASWLILRLMHLVSPSHPLTLHLCTSAPLTAATRRSGGRRDHSQHDVDVGSFCRRGHKSICQGSGLGSDLRFPVLIKEQRPGEYGCGVGGVCGCSGGGGRCIHHRSQEQKLKHQHPAHAPARHHKEGRPFFFFSARSIGATASAGLIGLGGAWSCVETSDAPKSPASRASSSLRICDWPTPAISGASRLAWTQHAQHARARPSVRGHAQHGLSCGGTLADLEPFIEVLIYLGRPCAVDHSRGVHTLAQPELAEYIPQSCCFGGLDQLFDKMRRYEDHPLPLAEYAITSHAGRGTNPDWTVHPGQHYRRRRVRPACAGRQRGTERPWAAGLWRLQRNRGYKGEPLWTHGCHPRTKLAKPGICTEAATVKTKLVPRRV